MLGSINMIPITVPKSDSTLLPWSITNKPNPHNRVRVTETTLVRNRSVDRNTATGGTTAASQYIFRLKPVFRVFDISRSDSILVPSSR